MVGLVALVTWIFLSLSLDVAGFDEFFIAFDYSGKQIERLQSISLKNGWLEVRAEVNSVIDELGYPLTPPELQELEAVAGVALHDIGSQPRNLILGWGGRPGGGRQLRTTSNVTYSEMSDIGWKLMVYVPWVAVWKIGGYHVEVARVPTTQPAMYMEQLDYQRPEYYYKFQRDKLWDRSARCGRPAFS
jgi:hypothetical protein